MNQAILYFTNNKAFITINFYSLMSPSMHNAVENDILTRYLRKYHMVHIFHMNQVFHISLITKRLLLFINIHSLMFPLMMLLKSSTLRISYLPVFGWRKNNLSEMMEGSNPSFCKLNFRSLKVPVMSKCFKNRTKRGHAKLGSCFLMPSAN